MRLSLFPFRSTREELKDSSFDCVARLYNLLREHRSELHFKDMGHVMATAEEGQRTDLTQSYGIKPFVFRDEWHFFKFPYLLYGRVPLTNFWEGRPSDEVLATVSEEEMATIGGGGQLGLDAFTTINRVFFPKSLATLDRRVLFKLVMARTDLYTTVALLKFMPHELWNALYHGHQSAEKSLKAFLSAKGVTDKAMQREHRHDLGSLLQRCAELDQRFSPREALLPYMAWDSDWRYTPFSFHKQAVVNMFDCAMILLADVVDALAPSPHSAWPSRVITHC